MALGTPGVPWANLGWALINLARQIQNITAKNPSTSRRVRGGFRFRFRLPAFAVFAFAFLAVASILPFSLSLRFRVVVVGGCEAPLPVGVPLRRWVRN